MTLDDLHRVSPCILYQLLYMLIVVSVQLNRFQEPGSHGLLCDLLWADPIANYGHEHENSIHGPGLKPGTMFEHNATRGCSYFFT